MNFPLYNTLEKKVTKKSDIKIVEKKECIEMISRLDKNGKEILIILIYLYYKNNNQKYIEVIPYEGEYIQKNNTIDIEWNMNKFPIKLKHILYEFLKMHINSMDIIKQKENLS